VRTLFVLTMDSEFLTMEPSSSRQSWSPRNSLRSMAVLVVIGLVCVATATLKPLGINTSTGLGAASTSDFEWVEARASNWNGAANAVIAKLTAAGVKRGQIISIDAHNNGPNGDAIFSAHYSKSYPSDGDLHIVYSDQNTASYGWAGFYNNAIADAQEDVTDLISITSSNNAGGRAVTYVFKYVTAASQAESRMLTWKEARAGSWNGAANHILAQIKASGAQRGQVLGIDAHNNGPDGDAIFSAVLDLTAPGYGALDIGYHVQNTAACGRASFYTTASGEATTDVISFTSSCNANGGAVTYVFYYK